MRSYSGLILLPTFEERLEYLALNGVVGDETFGYDRYLNQMLYHNREFWMSIRDQVIIRDNGCDLACADREIPKGCKIIVHHIEPITVEDIYERSQKVYGLDNLVSTTLSTHNAIHYSNLKSKMPSAMVERKPNDQTPWR